MDVSRMTQAQIARVLLWIGLWVGAFSLIGVASQGVQMAAPVTLSAASVAVLLVFAAIGAVVFFGLGISAVVHLLRVLVRVEHGNGTAS